MVDLGSEVTTLLAFLYARTEVKGKLSYATLEGLGVKKSLQKFRLWQETWTVLSEFQQPEVTFQAYWGAEGWSSIQHLLDDVVKLSKEIQGHVSRIQENQKGPVKRWWSAIGAARSNRSASSSPPDLRSLVVTLTAAIDLLCMYSDVVYETLHGVREIEAPSRDRLLAWVIQSRAASVQLYIYGIQSSYVYSCDPDLFPDSSRSAPQLAFQLFTRNYKNLKEFKTLVVENTFHEESTESEVVCQVDNFEGELFEPSTAITVLKLPEQGQRPGNVPCLRMLKSSIVGIHLGSDPEKLINILGYSSTHGFKATRLELAFKIVEFGFFLLGTPWLSDLSSKTVRMWSSDGRQRFMLDIQPLDFTDLLLDDHEALLESSQLFRIGLLLMEIALDKQIDPSLLSSDKMHYVHLLFEVEQAMGPEYCRATAFCLQRQRSHETFWGSDKYSGAHREKWESFLNRFLRDYYAQVYSRFVNDVVVR